MSNPKGGVCASCGKHTNKLDRGTLCNTCYTRDYRKKRRAADPAYKPWKSHKKKRVSVTLSDSAAEDLGALKAGQRSQLVERLLQTALHGIVIMTDKHGVVTINAGKTGEKIGFSTAGALAGKHVHDVFAGDVEGNNAWDAALAGKQVIGLFSTGPHMITVRLTPILDKRGRVESVVGIGFLFRDPDNHEPAHWHAVELLK